MVDVCIGKWWIVRDRNSWGFTCVNHNGMGSWQTSDLDGGCCSWLLILLGYQKMVILELSIAVKEQRFQL